MYVSRNYYEKGWGMRTHRRLKNITVILDFCPSQSKVKEIALEGKAFTPKQELNLRKAFSLADVDKSGGISLNELTEVLRAVDVDVDAEVAANENFIKQMMQYSGLANRSQLTFEQLKDMLTKRMYYRVQSGRYYVALSLSEAQSLRAAMHLQLGTKFLPDKDTNLALRAVDGTLLDCSEGYLPAETYQSSTTQASYRFIDSAISYSSTEISYLIKAMQENSCQSRLEFFTEVRSNRRRTQKDPGQSSLSNLFVTSDEHHMLQYRIAVGRIISLLRSRGLYARDAFAAIDQDNDGLLTPQELQVGLEWLGLNLESSLTREFLSKLDKNNSGKISLEEFKDAVSWEDDNETAASSTIPNFQSMPVMPKMITEGDRNKSVEIPRNVLANIKIKVKKVTRFGEIWTSRGSMSREKGSIWEPIHQSGGFQKNKTVVCVGHYSGAEFNNPSRDNLDRLSIEVTDTSSNWVGGSSWLPHVLNKFLPHPARFSLAWSLPRGSNPFYAWQPVPPSEDFVALGMVGTRTEDHPKLESVRCVPKSWVCESNITKMVWNDGGSGGRESSIWIVNSLNLVSFESGKEPPATGHWDVRSTRFFLKDYTDMKKK
mmetsp:Transcript_46255/g.54052  ORF Transcript_46255/g.54052 Transcript_46255/m.54052 type:complete len:600 (+) Transcript_46255:393-2192(+)